MKNLTIKQVRNFLDNKGFNIIKKNKNNFFGKDLKSFYYTFLSSLLVIILFFSIPGIIEIKNNSILSSKEVQNSSKSNFEKVLDGEVLKKKDNIDDKLNTKDLFEDVFKLDDLPSDTVRLNAPTIEQLFKDTGYNLQDIRKTKLVKPISLSLLPREMKMIENVKKRKNLFIKIILPLVIGENDKIRLERKKLFSILNKNKNLPSEKKWLKKKFKQYGVVNSDLSTLKIRMDIVPVSLAIAQAAKETGWGTSRFALEGNALFGQWTWTGEGIKPAGSNSEDTHKVMKFKILKSSIRAYQRNLNTHSTYREFRLARADLRDNQKKLDSILLSNYLDEYAETGEEYVRILKKIIQQNDLTDFDDAKLLPSSIQLKSLI